MKKTTTNGKESLPWKLQGMKQKRLDCAVTSSVNGKVYVIGGYYNNNNNNNNNGGHLSSGEMFDP